MKIILGGIEQEETAALTGRLNKVTTKKADMVDEMFPGPTALRDEWYEKLWAMTPETSFMDIFTAVELLYAQLSADLVAPLTSSGKWSVEQGRHKVVDGALRRVKRNIMDAIERADLILATHEHKSSE